MTDISPPSYYMMDDTRDLFAWLESLPYPDLPAAINLQAMTLWFTGFRYARRCLWKEDVLKDKACDARKAATCFLRLAEFLEEDAHQQKIWGDKLEALEHENQ